jgi:hypothetical protein
VKWPSDSIARCVGRVFESAQTSVLALTISVQGLVVAAQLFAAGFVEPTVLGRIRWLESAFAITLLATSCGMPSLVFRESAMTDREGHRSRLLIDAAVLTALATLVTVLAGFVMWNYVRRPAWDWAGWALIVMAIALIPANAARIAVAVVQGSQQSRQHAPRLAVISGAGVLVLSVGAAWGATTIWVGLRVVVESILATVLWQRLLVARALAGWSRGCPGRLYGLFRTGFGANYAFLVRVLADNLPLLLLPIVLGQGTEVGWYGFANLVLFAPMLLMSTAMQSRLPALIRSIRNVTEFTALAGAATRHLMAIAMLWCVAILAFAGILHAGWLMPSYSGAAAPLAVLTLGLPARALVLRAGAAAVAQGWFARSSVLALCEILVVAVAFASGIVDATVMAASVTVALWISSLAAWWIVRSAEDACR